MDRIRGLVGSRVAYEPLENEVDPLVDVGEGRKQEFGFSWLVYSIFLLLGIAMLWAWYVFPVRHA
jgi:hypothetical protein